MSRRGFEQMFGRIGELLVEYGELSQGDLEDILQEQKRVYRPFGRIAASRFGVSDQAIWRAWAQQYACYCPRIDVRRESADPDLIDRLTRDQAVALSLLPLREQDGDLIMVTVEPMLDHVLRFVDESPDFSAVIWLTDDLAGLNAKIESMYPAGQKTAGEIDAA
jgi:MSHA biogenesis protein MshE